MRAYFRARRRRSHILAVPPLVAVLVAVSLTHLPGAPADAADVESTPTVSEVAAGLAALAGSYPGGWAGLLGLFDTGECAGVGSLDSASPECRAVLDTITGMGAGGAFPEVLPSLWRPDEPDGPQAPPDPDDMITPERVAQFEAEGGPSDLVDGLRQDPPVVPPAYRTMPYFQGATRPDDVLGFGGFGGFGIAGVDPTRATLTDTVPPPTTETATETSTSETTETTTSTTTATPTPTSEPTETTTSTTTEPTTTSTTEPTTTTATATATATDTTAPTTEPTTAPTDTTVPTGTPPPPPPPQPPLLVAVGDSVTSGHEARPPGPLFWTTVCDAPGVNAAAPGSSWAGLLRGLVGVPWNRYFNYAHSGASTVDVLGTSPYTNPCGVVSQPARPQIGDATAILAANPSRPGAANVAVATAGVNDTNWVAVATQIVSRNLGGRVAAAVGPAAPAWALINRGTCLDWALGQPLGNATPGVPPGAIPPAWNGVASSGGIAAGSAITALSLIAADPGAQVRHLLYYRWLGDPNLPAVCMLAARTATGMINDWISMGILIAKVLWLFRLGDPRRIQAVCALAWPNVASLQTRLMSRSAVNGAVVPGWPHPNAAGRGALANCVNGALPRAPGGGIA